MKQRLLFAVAAAVGAVLFALVWRFACAPRSSPDRASLLRQAQAAFDRGADAEAIDAWRRALAIEDDAQVHANLGSSLLRTGHADEARAEFNRALALRPKDARAWYEWGEALRTRFHDVRAAERACRRALELDPDLAEAHLGLGLALGELGDYDGAKAEIEAALSLAPAEVRWREDAERALAFHHMRANEARAGGTQPR